MNVKSIGNCPDYASPNPLGNRNCKGPFGVKRKVPKEPRGVNRANQRSENEGVSACEKGLTGPFAKDVAKECDTLWRVGWGRGPRGVGGSQ